MKSSLVLPIRTLHGTPVEELAELYSNARNAVRTILARMDDASPNGRDYYLIGMTALSAAVMNRAPISAALHALSQELLALSDPEYHEPDAKLVGLLLPTVSDRPKVMPMIHLNGTSAAELRKTAVAVFKAAGECEPLLRAVTPNARDYDSQEQWQVARQQHLDRISLVRTVGGYFLCLAQGCK